MASLNFSVSIESSDCKNFKCSVKSTPKLDIFHHLSFCRYSIIGSRGCYRVLQQPFGYRLNLQVSNAETGLIDKKYDQFDAAVGIDSTRNEFFDKKMNSGSSPRVDGRDLWKRVGGGRQKRVFEGSGSLEPNASKDNILLSEKVMARSTDEVEEDRRHTDASFYNVGPKSSLARCNTVLRRLERCSDRKTMEFFEWMRTNDKLEGNYMAYNLALRVLARRGDWDAADNLIEEMKCVSGCELGYQVFNTMIYTCSKRGLVDLGTKWFRMMLDYGCQPNDATFGMIMKLYQKGWNLEEAEFAFSQLRKFSVKCQSAYSSMITIYTRLSLYNKAERVIDALLSKEGMTLNLENWLVMLNVYSQQGKMEKADSVVILMQKAGFAPNIIAYNTLITGYGKISRMSAAQVLFDNLQNVGLHPDETTYRSMIEGWARAGNYSRVKSFYQELKNMGFKPNSSNLHTLVNMQAQHGDEKGVVTTLDDMVKTGCQLSAILSAVLHAFEKAGRFDRVPSILRGLLYEYVLNNQTACSILTMDYSKHGLVDDAIELLQAKRWKGRIFEDNLYHLLICSCKELGHLENAVKIYTHMPQSADKPNLHIASTMIDIYSVMNRFHAADCIYKDLIALGVAMDLVAYSIVVRMYIKAGMLEDACTVLDDMDKQKGIVPDVYLLRDMLRVYQKCGKKDKLSGLYNRILKEGVNWDQEMYNCVLNCCARALHVDELSRLFDEMLQRGFIPNTITYNVMLDVYGKSKLFKKARKVLSMARKQGLTDVISYNTLVAAYGQSSDLNNMVATVKMMEFNGFSVSLEAYNSMLDAYGRKRQMENFRSVLLKLKESNYVSDNYTYNILINIYGEHGWIEEVADVLTELKEYGPGPDLYSYNTLIKAYGIAGMVEDAVSVVKEMRENGIKPDRITYLNLISALRRNDQYLDAVKWSLWMKQMGLSQ